MRHTSNSDKSVSQAMSKKEQGGPDQTSGLFPKVSLQCSMADLILYLSCSPNLSILKNKQGSGDRSPSVGFLPLVCNQTKKENEQRIGSARECCCETLEKRLHVWSKPSKPAVVVDLREQFQATEGMVYFVKQVISEVFLASLISG